MSLFQNKICATDLAYINCRDCKEGPAVEGRKLVDSLWEKYEPFADSNFETALAKDFDARFWEMYLTCVLLENKLNVVDRNSRKKEGPDVLISEKKNIWIEAIAPKEGSFPNGVPQPKI